MESLLSLALGYGIFNFFTHPSKYFKSHVPKIRFSKIEFLPNVKIKSRNYIIWIHHWIIFSIAVIVLLFITRFTQLILVKSFFVGGIIQGFTYSDRFNIIIRQTASQKD